MYFKTLLLFWFSGVDDSKMCAASTLAGKIPEPVFLFSVQVKLQGDVTAQMTEIQRLKGKTWTLSGQVSINNSSLNTGFVMVVAS